MENAWVSTSVCADQAVLHHGGDLGIILQEGPVARVHALGREHVAAHMRNSLITACKAGATLQMLGRRSEHSNGTAQQQTSTAKEQQ
jgi:hypothetical protein